SLARTTGQRPTGWQSRYSPGAHTRALLVQEGGFLYDADSYADDLPYWVKVGGKPHLIVPHTFTNNANRYARGRIGTADDCLSHLSAAFRVLRAESELRPRLMTVSLHCRVSGQPARFDA